MASPLGGFGRQGHNIPPITHVTLPPEAALIPPRRMIHPGKLQAPEQEFIPGELQAPEQEFVPKGVPEDFDMGQILTMLLGPQSKNKPSVLDRFQHPGSDKEVFEIPDNLSRLFSGEGKKGIEKLFNFLRSGDEMMLDRFLKHDSLINKAPYLKKTTVRGKRLPVGTTGTQGSRKITLTDKDTEYIPNVEEWLDHIMGRSKVEDRPDSILGEVLGTTLHETQHEVQEEEELPSGSSNNLWREILITNPPLFEQVTGIHIPNSLYKSGNSYIGGAIDTDNELIEILAKKAYLETTGEAVSRATSRRRGLTPSERKENPLFQDLDSVQSKDKLISMTTVERLKIIDDLHKARRVERGWPAVPEETVSEKPTSGPGDAARRSFETLGQPDLGVPIRPLKQFKPTKKGAPHGKRNKRRADRRD